MLDRRHIDYSGPALHERIVTLEEHKETMIVWRRSIDENTQATLEMTAIGKDIVSAMRVLGWVGSAVKWLAGVGAAVGVIYATCRGWVNL